MSLPALSKLLVCRSLTTDAVLGQLAALETDERVAYAFCASLLQAAERYGLCGNAVAAYLLHRLTTDENLAAQTVELCGGALGEGLRAAFAHDIALLVPLMTTPPSAYLPTSLFDAYVPTRARDASDATAPLFARIASSWTAEDMTEALLAYYRQYGAGDMARYRAFRWETDGGLIGIDHFEPILLTDIIGYEKQKAQIVANTEAFLADRPANNVLLVGARGTGKSSAVKAIANGYFPQGLRLVQVAKNQLADLPRIMQYLRRFAAKRFILYLDDLSFEDTETEYKYLKSGIEGGVEARPANVLLYATSNRRHLIKETWRDRADGQDELYMTDSVNETISLSDRFGLIIDYRTPNQSEYLAIIDHYLRASGVALSAEELRVLGLRWEMEHSGRSGRTARQFVDYYLGQKREAEA